MKLTYSNDKIASLIGSRICHDLVSPVGAVANGLELLELSGVPNSPELSLVAESAGHASARIRLFRLAFGDPAGAQGIKGQSVAAILAEVYGTSRIAVSWQAPGDHARPVIRAVLLALLCVEQAMGAGGKVEIGQQAGGGWHVRAHATRLTADPALWGLLQGKSGPVEITPAAVQFALLPEALRNLDMKSDVQITANTVEIAFYETL